MRREQLLPLLYDLPVTLVKQRDYAMIVVEELYRMRIVLSSYLAIGTNNAIRVLAQRGSPRFAVSTRDTASRTFAPVLVTHREHRRAPGPALRRAAPCDRIRRAASAHRSPAIPSSDDERDVRSSGSGFDALPYDAR